MNHRVWSAALAVAIAVTSADARAGDRRPNIYVLATGGTISGAQASGTSYGYKSGAVDINSLLKTVPNLDRLAVITAEQVANIGSQDMNDAIWLKLAKRVD